MEMNVLPDTGNVEIWLTKAEKNDPQLRAELKGVYAEWKQKGYLIAVYESGDRDLYQDTLDLLAYNKRRLAELEVRKAKAWERAGKLENSSVETPSAKLRRQAAPEQ